jgi:hypothetical protein
MPGLLLPRQKRKLLMQRLLPALRSLVIILRIREIPLKAAQRPATTMVPRPTQKMVAQMGRLMIHSRLLVILTLVLMV